MQLSNAFSGKCTAYGMRIGFVPNAWNGLRGAYHCAELPYFFGTIRDMDYSISDAAVQESELFQSDMLSFIQSGMIAGKETYAEDHRILRYRKGTVKTEAFPQRDIIMETWDTDLYDVIRKDFMRGRDNQFIA